ncbi:elongation factor G [bacterium]|nr:elongation factor G [candidate division CSSED10-310 bacterium]
MSNITTEAIRNLVLAGHSSTGKTTLLEALLYKKGITTRLGRVEEKNTISDFEPEEKERGYSIFSSVSNFSHEDCYYNLIDLPGYTDFVGAGYGPLRVVESALLLVSATTGVEVNTKRFYDLAVRHEVPVIILVTKLDAERAKFDEVMAQIEDTFGAKCKLIGKPERSEGGLSGISYIFGDNPDQRLRGDFIETALEADDELLESYLEGEEITDEILATLIPKALVSGSVIPVLPISSIKDLGLDVLLHFLNNYGIRPDALPRTFLVEEEEKPLKQGSDAPGCAFIFKTVSDPFVGKINFFRVFSGTITGQVSYWLSTTGKTERFGNINKVQGKDMSAIDSLTAGDIGAVAKVDSLSTGANFCAESNKIVLTSITPPTPMVSLAIEPKERSDEQRLNDSLRRITEEDITFRVERNKQTKELVAWGMGNLHIDILLAKMKRKYDVSVNTKPPKIAYLETITGNAECRYRHKKQTGGAGQFAEVAIKIRPTERGGGFVFENTIFGGAIPGQYVPSVEKGVVNVMEEGVIAGYQVVDVTVDLWDGKDHPVDSKDIAFQIAGREAFKEAFQQAKPTFLEPIANIEVFVPSNFLGDVISDLNSRRGRIMGTEALGTIQVVKASVPMAEVQSYSNDLRSMTGGEGIYNLEFSHYDIVPASLKDQIVQQSKTSKD